MTPTIAGGADYVVDEGILLSTGQLSSSPTLAELLGLLQAIDASDSGSGYADMPFTLRLWDTVGLQAVYKRDTELSNGARTLGMILTPSNAGATEFRAFNPLQIDGARCALAAGANVLVSMPAGLVQDAMGNKNDASTLSFATQPRDCDPPVLRVDFTNVYPINAVDVDVTTAVRLVFSEVVQATQGAEVTLTPGAGAPLTIPLASAAVRLAGDTVLVMPPALGLVLTPGDSYTVSFSAYAFVDLTGQPARAQETGGQEHPGLPAGLVQFTTRAGLTFESADVLAPFSPRVDAGVVVDALGRVIVVGGQGTGGTLGYSEIARADTSRDINCISLEASLPSCSASPCGGDCFDQNDTIVSARLGMNCQQLALADECHRAAGLCPLSCGGCQQGTRLQTTVIGRAPSARGRACLGAVRSDRSPQECQLGTTWVSSNSTRTLGPTDCRYPQRTLGRIMAAADIPCECPRCVGPPPATPATVPRLQDLEFLAAYGATHGNVTVPVLCQTGYRATAGFYCEVRPDSDFLAQWGPLPSCIAMPCPGAPPQVPAAVAVTCPDPTEHRYCTGGFCLSGNPLVPAAERTCGVQCDAGHYPTGGDGELSGHECLLGSYRSDVRCERKMCAGSNSIDNGMFTNCRFNDSRLGDNCTLVCDRGYRRRVASPFRVCTVDDAQNLSSGVTWVGASECVPQQCATPPLDEFADESVQECRNALYLQRCRVGCLAGYGPGGVFGRTTYDCGVKTLCQDRDCVGWVGGLPCQPLACSELPDEPHGTLDCSSTALNTTCALTCDVNSGYAPDGPATFSCSVVDASLGTVAWTSTPVCVPQPCVGTPFLAAVGECAQLVPHDGVCLAECPEDRVLSAPQGSTLLRCQFGILIGSDQFACVPPGTSASRALAVRGSVRLGFAEADAQLVLGDLKPKLLESVQAAVYRSLASVVDTPSRIEVELQDTSQNEDGRRLQSSSVTAIYTVEVPGSGGEASQQLILEAAQKLADPLESARFNSVLVQQLTARDLPIHETLVLGAPRAVEIAVIRPIPPPAEDSNTLAVVLVVCASVAIIFCLGCLGLLNLYRARRATLKVDVEKEWGNDAQIVPVAQTGGQISAGESAPALEDKLEVHSIEDHKQGAIEDHRQTSGAKPALEDRRQTTESKALVDSQQRGADAIVS